MNEFEQKLFQSGFSAKDLRKLKDMLTRDENKLYTPQSLVQELSKRFWAGIICMATLISFFIYGVAKGHQQSLLSYAIVLMVGAVVVYLVIPMNLAWKSYKFTRACKR